MVTAASNVLSSFLRCLHRLDLRLNCGAVVLGTRMATARAPRQAPRGPLTRSVPGEGESRDEQLNGASPLDQDGLDDADKTGMR